MEKKKSKRLRFIPNKYDLNSIDINKDLKEIYSHIELSEKNSKKYFPPNMSKSIDSLGKKKMEKKKLQILFLWEIVVFIYFIVSMP